jgi:hypothetical protein
MAAEGADDDAAISSATVGEGGPPATAAGATVGVGASSIIDTASGATSVDLSTVGITVGPPATTSGATSGSSHITLDKARAWAAVTAAKAPPQVKAAAADEVPAAKAS